MKNNLTIGQADNVAKIRTLRVDDHDTEIIRLFLLEALSTLYSIKNDLAIIAFHVENVEKNNKTSTGESYGRQY